MDLEFFKMHAKTMLDYADTRTLEFVYYFLLRRIDWKSITEKDDPDINPSLDC